MRSTVVAMASVPCLCMQVGESPTPDRQDGEQGEGVLSLLLQRESTDGNIRLTTAAPELMAAAVEKQPAQSADEPLKMSPEHQVTVACPHQVHRYSCHYCLLCICC